MTELKWASPGPSGGISARAQAVLAEDSARRAAFEVSAVASLAAVLAEHQQDQKAMELERRQQEAWGGLIDTFSLDEPQPPAALAEAVSYVKFAYRLLTVYSVTPETYFRLLVKQQGVCDICKTAPDPGRRLSVDHDHKCCPTSKSCGRCVRSLLCTSCNWMVGRVELSGISGAAVDAYLAKHC